MGNIIASTLVTALRPYAIKYALMSVLLTALLLALFMGTSTWVISWLDAGDSNWLAFAGFAGTALISFFLFPLLMPLVSLAFLDPLAAHMEREYYPQAQRMTSQRFLDALPGMLGFLGKAILLNFLLLPALFIPPLYFIGYYMVNGYLFGREYFELIAERYLPFKEIKPLRQRHRGFIWLLGALIAVGFTVPLVNLFMPMIATVLMMHGYWRLREG